ncbi:hypothetical protein ACTJJB_23700 [Chitinophaga sp. 22536]|uniref:hypothetical protein n=1 Tax=unclassified Chitinophaga TaxID=2619133 RepID=UPI003F8428A9
MAKHNVYFDLPEREIGNVDAHFKVYKDGEKLGQITISKGGIDYYPNKRKKPITINWTQFDELMKNFEGK